MQLREKGDRGKVVGCGVAINGGCVHALNAKCTCDCHNKVFLRRSEKEVLETLKLLIKTYDDYKVMMSLGRDEALEKAIVTYDDFYDWLQEQD